MIDLRAWISQWVHDVFGKGDGERPQTVYCDASSKNARRIFTELGHRFARTSSDADLLWVRKNASAYVGTLRPGQLLNHIPREDLLIDKGNLTRSLKHYDGEEASGLRSHDLYQESYRLYDDADRRRFLRCLPRRDDPKNLWILKPTSLSKGLGIRILWRFRTLRKQLQDPARYNLDLRDFRYIAQRYIQNPLLLDGRKSEIRVYWLIASLDPLLVLVYREGTVRLNTLPFKLDDFGNPLIHVTNVYQQKNHADFDPEAVLKWDFAHLQRDLVARGKTDREDFIEAELMPKLKRYLAHVTRAAARHGLAECPDQGAYFGLYGADLILDENLHPWLTEVQEGPGLAFDDPIKARVIPPMLDEAVRIMFEVRSRRERGESLAELNAVDGFEWVLNEASAPSCGPSPK